MELYSAFKLKFEKANWAKNPEFGLLDTLLDLQPELLLLIKDDVLVLSKKALGNRKSFTLAFRYFFSEDKCRCRKGYAPENLALFRKIALQITSRVEDKLSIKKRRYKASLNNQYLEKILLI